MLNKADKSVFIGLKGRFAVRRELCMVFLISYLKTNVETLLTIFSIL